MIAKLIRWSISNRFLVLLATVMLTGFVEPDRQSAILASGVREILRKPPSLAELGQALALHLAARSVAP